MKLESLQSRKFKELSNSSMNKIKGGYEMATNGGGTYQGKPIVRDVHNFETNTGTIYFADGSSAVVKTAIAK